MKKIKKTFQINNKGGVIKIFSIDWKHGKPEWGNITVKSPTLNSFPKEVTVEIDPDSLDYDTEVKDEIEVRIDEERTTIPVSFITRKTPFYEYFFSILGEIVKGIGVALVSLVVTLFYFFFTSPLGFLIFLILLAFIGNGTHN